MKQHYAVCAFDDGNTIVTTHNVVAESAEDAIIQAADLIKVRRMLDE